jgi:hypothetical protein
MSFGGEASTLCLKDSARNSNWQHPKKMATYRAALGSNVVGAQARITDDSLFAEAANVDLSTRIDASTSGTTDRTFQEKTDADNRSRWRSVVLNSVVWQILQLQPLAKRKLSAPPPRIHRLPCSLAVRAKMSENVSEIYAHTLVKTRSTSVHS